MSVRLKDPVPRRSDYGDALFCTACGSPIGLSQRVRILDELPVHLGCFRRAVRQAERVEALAVHLAGVLELGGGDGSSGPW